MSKFPQKLFVKIEKHGKDLFYIMSEKFSDLSEDDTPVDVAVYELAEVGRLASSSKQSKPALRRVK